MEDELEKAVAELIEAYDFFMDISEFTTEEMVEAVEERAPSFIEHIEMMEEPPKTASEFLEGFFIWTLSRLREKYRHIWDKAVDTYFHSETHKKRLENAKFKSGAMGREIEKILRDLDF